MLSFSTEIPGCYNLLLALMAHGVLEMHLSLTMMLMMLENPQEPLDEGQKGTGAKKRGPPSLVAQTKLMKFQV